MANTTEYTAKATTTAGKLRELAELMRLGATIVERQGRGSYLVFARRFLDGQLESPTPLQLVEACAIGMAAVGMEIGELKHTPDAVRARSEQTSARVALWLEEAGLLDFEHGYSLPATFSSPDPDVDEQDLSYYSGPGYSTILSGLIVALNDDWHWTTAQIADYLDELAAAEEAKETTAVPVSAEEGQPQ